MTQRRLGGLMSVVCIMFCVIPHFVIAQVSPQQPQLTYTLKFSESDLIFDELMGFDVIKVKDGDVVNDIGKPMMPAKEIKIALPAGMSVEGIRIAATKTIDIEGEYTIFPAQPPVRISETPENFVEPELETYTSTEPYPGAVVKFIDMTDLAGQGIAVIDLYPVQYIPRDKKITLYTEISFAIKLAKGYECGDYLPMNISEQGKRSYEKMVKDMVINPEDVQLHSAPHGFIDNRSLPSGSYDHVIITSTSYQSYWSNLVNWHTKRGLKDTVVTTTYIYANYTGDNQQKIRSFVIDAHSTWGTMYFLMGGENGTVPFEYHTWTDESTPSDQYYSDYDDDWTHEVYVGRASISSTTEANTFINKVLNYEKNPPLTDYILDVLLIGMDADAYTDLEDLKENIDGVTPDIPARFNVTKVYDSDGGNHKTAAVAALNAGQNLVNHADHGWYNYMGTGDYNHGWGISNSDVDALTNNGKPSIITSLACDPNGMDYSSYDCIAEHFVIYNSNQAGVAFNGNTRSGYYYQGQPISLSGILDRDWWRAVFDYYETTLGAAINRAKHLFSNSNNDYRHCEWTFNLLGEPAMPIWTATPESFDVTHPATLPTGSSSFLVHVEEVGAGNVNNAYVCLWKGNEVYETGNTNSGGDVTLYPAPSTEGTMYVTVTKYDYNDNYLPYEGTATVIESPEFILTIYINPEGSGSVVKNPDLETYPADTPVELTANGILPWQFDHWSDSLTGSQNPTTIIMNSDKVVTANFIIPGHILNLTDFPMYETSSGDSSGAAAAQMALNYMWWDSDLDPEPPMTYTQAEVYDTAFAYSGAAPLLDVNGVWKALQILRPLPYTVYGYNFNKYTSTDNTVMLKRICQWIDYTIGTYGGHVEGYPLHVPGVIPAYGGYTNWMAVRGIHTDTIAYPMPPDLTVYGFWINDPYPGGIGENSYKTTDQFLDTYYHPLGTGDQWDGLYVGILEPPEEVDGCALHIPIPVPHFTTEQTAQIDMVENLNDIPFEIKGWIIQAAIDGVNEHLIPYDQGFKALFSRTKSGEPVFVQSYGDENYFCVPFVSAVQAIDIRENKTVDQEIPIADNKAMVVILVDAHDGSFKEASWTTVPAPYLPLSQDRAREIAFETTEELGIEVDINSLKPELIHRNSTPYYPEWRVIVADYAIYISQDGAVSVEEWELGPPGGPTSAGDGLSFTYALNTGVPTPFVKSTVISYSIARPGNVSLMIYDVSGRLVKTLVQAEQNAGVYNLVWNGYDNNNQRVAPGVYFTKLASGDYVSVKKLILVK